MESHGDHLNTSSAAFGQTEFSASTPLNSTQNSIDVPKIIEIFNNLRWYFEGDKPRHLTPQEALDIINMLETEDTGQWPNDYCLGSLYRIATLDLNTPNTSSLVELVKDSIHRFSERCRLLLQFSADKPEIYDRIRPIFEPVFGDVDLLHGALTYPTMPLTDPSRFVSLPDPNVLFTGPPQFYIHHTPSPQQNFASDIQPVQPVLTDDVQTQSILPSDVQTLMNNIQTLTNDVQTLKNNMQTIESCIVRITNALENMVPFVTESVNPTAAANENSKESRQ